MGTIPADAIDRVEQERVIVIADDSISVRKFVGRMLEKNGYRVKLAADGLEAAELVAQHGCHLVITDLEMPRMTGYELMAQLRQSPATRRIPVMVVTSRAGAKHRDRAMKEGATSFLTKPVQEDQLLFAVEQLIGTEAARPVVPVGIDEPWLAAHTKNSACSLWTTLLSCAKSSSPSSMPMSNLQVVGHAKDGREAIALVGIAEAGCHHHGHQYASC